MQKRVIEYLKGKDKTISNTEYQVLFDISRNTASNDLTGLVEKGDRNTDRRGKAKYTISAQMMCKKCAKTDEMEKFLYSGLLRISQELNDEVINYVSISNNLFASNR